MPDDAPDDPRPPAAPSGQTRQRQLITALRDRLAHEFADDVEQIETHISILLLTRDRVYKIKKAVTLDFVDYGSLACRRACCEAELRLNRRFAPALYLRCVAIGGTPSQPMLDREPAIEYAVEMQRFPAEAQADVRARDGRLALGSIDALAETIAGYHACAERAMPADEHDDGTAVVGATVRSNVDQLQRAGPSPIQVRLAPLVPALERLLKQTEPSLAERRTQGRVRECHGDMHLANLIYRDRRWSAFDCIEFDPALRWIDVMDDLAFPLMDLQAYGLARHAHRLLNRYLEITGDYLGLGVLRLYLVHRALVRAKIALLSAADRAGYRRPADYLTAAMDLARPRARLVITHGISGSGKSRAAAYVAERFGFVRIRSDVERKRLYGRAAHDRGAAHAGAPLYAPNATAATYAQLLKLARPALLAGWPIILDATFLERRYRDAARALAAHVHCRFHILDLAVDADTARQRIQARAGSDASDADRQVLDHQLDGYQPLAPDEQRETLTTRGDTTDLERWFSAWQTSSPGY
ncbi:AAA family ATPase [Salinisphaera sp. SPP-AMP-43]|uniref:bifunctional aminoglycoside phosphotransferase/ATP-binding protein n=1 Tax=Salinisphaera sp. SPP-AMP-43 TaxID=3121288 RepID=UPI003C6DF3F8